MKVDDLKLVEEVARRGSFAATARALGLDPSGVSRAVAGLEADLGVRLFTRNTRSLALTDAGERFLQRLTPALASVDAAVSDARDTACPMSGLIRIGASALWTETMLLPLLHSFQREHSDIRVEVRVTDSRESVVGEGLDLAVRHGPLPDSSLVARKLRDVRYLVVGPPELEVAEPDDLHAVPVLGYTFAPFDGPWRLTDGRREVTLDLQPRLRLGSPQSLLAAARAGQGAALLAAWAVERDVREGRLRNLLPAWRGAVEAEVHAVLPSRDFVPERVRVLLDAMAKS